MAAATTRERLAPRPVATFMGEVADALGWPRSRPVRLLAGDRSHIATSVVICANEESIAAVDDGTVVLLAVPADAATGGRSGKRGHDPFVGDVGDEPAGWRRAERTVLDAALLLAGGRGGVDERIAVRAGLDETSLSALRGVPMDTSKLVGFVPDADVETVRDAVFAVGAGTIGAYDMCSWSTSGTGTFRGGDGTNPAIGSAGSFEQFAEQRIEIVMPTRLVERACRAFVAAHPYEEPAFDVVQLATPSGVGFGRVGVLAVGGGHGAWSSLAEVDPAIVAYGPVATAPAGATCAVHAGALREVLPALLELEELGLVVVGAASEAELGLLVDRGIGVLVLDRTRGVHAVGAELAGLLTRATGLPVRYDPGLAFPAGDATEVDDEVQPAAQAAPAAGTWRLHFDGGSRGNPGPAAYGWSLTGPDGEEIDADGVKIGSATNNVAEWTGLLRGLERALEHGVTDLEVRGDSELVIKQVTGVYRVKNAALKPLADEVAALLPRFTHLDFAHVYRADNARADGLANEALDGLR